MNTFRAMFRGTVSLILTIVLPLTGNSIANSYGIYLLLIDRNIIIAVGLLVSFLLFIKEYADRRVKFKGLVGIIIVFIEVWYFLLFINMVSEISLPMFNTNISVQYMDGVSDVPGHLISIFFSLISSTSIKFPILGDLVMFSFGLVFLRSLLTMIGGRKFSRRHKEQQLETVVKDPTRSY